MAISSKTPITLTIAGSDSGGGAGIQADIKAISATGSYACSVITALTAQNTQGVSGILAVEPEFVEQQLDSVFTDLDVKAVKVGMLSDSNIIRVVATKLRQYQPKHLVVDPVMVATSGDLLLQQDAISSLKSELLPLADVITPNLPEAAALLGVAIPHSEQEMANMIDGLREIGAKSVLLKGGHLEQDTNSTDLLILANDVVRMSTPRIPTSNTHGTGCTLSSATASFLAQGIELTTAVQCAKSYITKAISHADELEIGSGHGPVHHFFAGHYQPE
ncbi:bifunctional hydroxymethylpyrimidine kinase/phosphomethylpyrimidine kinase [Photobacterium sp. OFAV2-7]|uniref:bifunctional hydroxymethylpyrimidine kinase/phosphomethylpyrimidine kinase n=1 Tax=Photobacterium sp. OFAV2-7 TaxID=2917748 RepID=UPI001EF63966|nr:bifunctional hydroxymethylpyrimidine kinase/phosphomethylpyrimidine kinase [Photobacterium sp. OFAV2-7]MCG7587982.1 bifunctional hydroxymethylpyrimidine kinase/phosphomethylpyrimidine kinase [Photobacterium sp. OFAV2-7]